MVLLEVVSVAVRAVDLVVVVEVVEAGLAVCLNSLIIL